MAKRTILPFECLDADQITELIKRARPGKVNAKIAWMRLVGRYPFVEIGAELGMDRRTVARRFDDAIRRMMIVHKCPQDLRENDKMTRQGERHVFCISKLLPGDEPNTATAADATGCACAKCDICIRKWDAERARTVRSDWHDRRFSGYGCNEAVSEALGNDGHAQDARL